MYVLDPFVNIGWISDFFAATVYKVLYTQYTYIKYIFQLKNLKF